MASRHEPHPDPPATPAQIVARLRRARDGAELSQLERDIVDAAINAFDHLGLLAGSVRELASVLIELEGIDRMSRLESLDGNLGKGDRRKR